MSMLSWNISTEMPNSLQADQDWQRRLVSNAVHPACRNLLQAFVDLVTNDRAVARSTAAGSNTSRLVMEAYASLMTHYASKRTPISSPAIISTSSRGDGANVPPEITKTMAPADAFASSTSSAYAGKS